MKREILIFTVLITNIAFSATLPTDIREVREISTDKKRTNTLAMLASQNLYDKGLDKNIANDRVLKHLKGNEDANELMAQNIIKNFSEIKHENIISHISESALFSKSIDLSSYHHIIALLQKKNKVTLNKVMLDKIARVSLENQNIMLLHRES